MGYKQFDTVVKSVQEGHNYTVK